MPAFFQVILAWLAAHAPDVLLGALLALIPVIGLWMRGNLSVEQIALVLKLSDTAFELVDRFARLNPAEDGFDKAARGLDEMRKLLRRDLTAKEKDLALKAFEAKHNEVKRQKASIKAVNQ